VKKKTNGRERRRAKETRIGDEDDDDIGFWFGGFCSGFSLR
jgi:hypothetical protein